MISGLSTFPRNMSSALRQYAMCWKKKTDESKTVQYAPLDCTRQQLESIGVTGILVV